MFVAGCTGYDELTAPQDAGNSGEIVNVSFDTALPGGLQVKTTLGNEALHKSVTWSEGDRLRVFYGQEADNHKEGTIILPQGTVSVEVPQSETYAAVYPVSEGSLSGNRLTMTIPSKQDGTFASANVMAALTTDLSRFFLFQNAAGLLYFDVVRDDLTKVVIRSNNGCAIAGTQTLTFDEDCQIAEVEHANEGGSPEITVPLNGPGRYYVAVMMDVTAAAGFGMRFFAGEQPLSGVLSTSAFIAQADIIQSLGTPEERISTGDYYIKADAAGTGLSWEDAAGPDMLRSLITKKVVKGITMDGVTLAWRLQGKTIHIAAGEYNLSHDGAAVELNDLDKLNFSIKGGYPEDAATGAVAAPAENEVTFKAESGTMFSLVALTDAEINISGITFSGADAKESGGAVCCDLTGNVRFADCKFIGCKSVKRGGAVHVASGNVHFDNCLFEGCVAGNGVTKWNISNSGGALSLEGEGSNAYIQKCIFDSNQAQTSADIFILAGAKAYANRSVFYGGYTTQTADEGYYYASSVTAYDGNAKIAPTFCANNCTFADSKSAWNKYGYLPVVTVTSAKSVICNSTMRNHSINFIAVRRLAAERFLSELYLYNNLFLQERAGSPAIKLVIGDKNGYFNVVNQATTTTDHWKHSGYGTGDDIVLEYADFNLSQWDMSKPYYTWTLTEGKYLPESRAVKSTLESKVVDAIPEFDTWLKTVEADPYGIDYTGATRDVSNMTPGSWEASNL